MKPLPNVYTQVSLRPLVRPEVDGAEVDGAEVRRELRRLIWERAGRVVSGSCALRSRFDEVGLMELVLAIEEAFDVDIESAEVEGAVTVDDLVILASERVAAWPGYPMLGHALGGMAGDRDSAPPSVR